MRDAVAQVGVSDAVTAVRETAGDAATDITRAILVVKIAVAPDDAGTVMVPRTATSATAPAGSNPIPVL